MDFLGRNWTISPINYFWTPFKTIIRREFNMLQSLNLHGRGSAWPFVLTEWRSTKAALRCLRPFMKNKLSGKVCEAVTFCKLNVTTRSRHIARSTLWEAEFPQRASQRLLEVPVIIIISLGWIHTSYVVWWILLLISATVKRKSCFSALSG